MFFALRGPKDAKITYLNAYLIQKLFFSSTASATYATAINPNGIKTFLANGLSTFSIKGKRVFSNYPERLP